MAKTTKTAVIGARTGIDLITAERREQVKKHDFTTDFDARFNTDGQLLEAAKELQSENPSFNPPFGWDVAIWDRMRNKPLAVRLTIAGALLAAEIDRMIKVGEYDPAKRGDKKR